MQPSPPPSSPPFPRPRSRFGLYLALGALVLVAGSAVGGYLVGASGVGHAALRVQVTNNMGSNQTIQVTVNGALAGTVPIAAGLMGTVDVPVAYATANGGAFQVSASTAAGPHDSTTVLVNTPGTFVVSLQIG